MKRWLVWVIGIALTAAAWCVIQVTPDREIAEAPFPVRASVGEEATARAFAVTASDPRVGERAVAGGWQADGTWLVVDLRVDGRGAEFDALGGGAALLYAEFVVDDVAYRASERPSSLLQTRPRVGVPQVGSVAFELPADLAESSGTLRISGDSESRLDSIVEIPLDLAALPHETEVELTPSGWAAP